MGGSGAGDEHRDGASLMWSRCSGSDGDGTQYCYFGGTLRNDGKQWSIHDYRSASRSVRPDGDQHRFREIYESSGGNGRGGGDRRSATVGVKPNNNHRSGGGGRRGSEHAKPGALANR